MAVTNLNYLTGRDRRSPIVDPPAMRVHRGWMLLEPRLGGTLAA